MSPEELQDGFCSDSPLELCQLCLDKDPGKVLLPLNKQAWGGGGRKVTFHDDVAPHYNDAIPRRLFPVGEHRIDHSCMAAHCFLNYKKG